MPIGSLDRKPSHSYTCIHVIFFWNAIPQARGGQLNYDGTSAPIGPPLADLEAPVSAKQTFLPDASLAPVNDSSSNSNSGGHSSPRGNIKGSDSSNNSSSSSSSRANVSVRYPIGQKVSVTFAEFFFVSIFLMATFMLRLETFTPPVEAFHTNYGKS